MSAASMKRNQFVNEDIGARGAVVDMEEAWGRGGRPLLSSLHDSQVRLHVLQIKCLAYKIDIL